MFENQAIFIISVLLLGNFCQLLFSLALRHKLLVEREYYREKEQIADADLLAVESSLAESQFRTDCLMAMRDENSISPFLEVLTRWTPNYTVGPWIYDIARDRFRPTDVTKIVNCRPRFTLAGRRRIVHLRQNCLFLGASEFVLRTPGKVTVPQLCILPLGESGQLFVTTALPDISADRQRNLVMLIEMCSLVSDSALTITHPDLQELEMAREMLELRTLTDHRFSTPKDLLEAFLSKVASAVGYDRASLYLLDDQNQRRILFAAGGNPLPANADEWTRIEAAFVEKHQDEKAATVLLTPEVLLDHKYSPPFVAGLLTPVFQGPDNVGVLILTSSETCRPDAGDLQLVRWAAEFLIQTLANELDRAKIEEQARLDELTQVANRRVFEENLEEMTARAIRHHSSCSLVLLDIDHFKQINDRYGHVAGDLVLRRVARCISNTLIQLRDSDQPLLCRYGGEEFSLLLPNADQTGATRIAEVIRKEIEQLTVEFEGEMISVTISSGVATLPRHAQDAQELVSRADAALYHAKRSGRNRVEEAVFANEETPQGV